MMNGQRFTRACVAVAAALLAVTGCGGSSEDALETTMTSAPAAVVVEGAELAGVQFDVRRDPG